MEFSWPVRGWPACTRSVTVPSSGLPFGRVTRTITIKNICAGPENSESNNSSSVGATQGTVPTWCRLAYSMPRLGIKSHHPLWFHATWHRMHHIFPAPPQTQTPESTPTATPTPTAAREVSAPQPERVRQPDVPSPAPVRSQPSPGQSIPYAYVDDDDLCMIKARILVCVYICMLCATSRPYVMMILCMMHAQIVRIRESAYAYAYAYASMYVPLLDSHMRKLSTPSACIINTRVCIHTSTWAYAQCGFK